MVKFRGPNGWSLLIYTFLVAALVLVGLQGWSVVATRQLVADAQTTAASVESSAVDHEKSREELIGRKVDNASKGALGIGLATSFSAVAAALVAISGAMLALRNYLDARAKEERDHLDARNKDRLDRFSARLDETITRLIAGEERQRVAGAAGLLPFFDPDAADFHLQALMALIAAARIKDETDNVRLGLRLAIERAARVVGNDVARQISWQRVVLPKVDLSGCDLRGLDLQQATLEDANLAGARLDQSNLTEVRLQGADLTQASLLAANLTYADLAGARLNQAGLSGAITTGVKVLNADLTETDFTKPGEGWRGIPWDATRNWRQARFDADVRAVLDQRYGPDVPSMRVFMLMWEIPPSVAGGSWTACYHLVRNLRRRGADVTVIVPWARGAILPMPFGVEVPIVALGIELPNQQNAAHAPYLSSAGWSPYGGGTPFWSSYLESRGPAVYGAYATGIYPTNGRYAAAGLSGSILYRMIGEFRRRVAAHLLDNPANLIHAHDWVTFDAAREAARSASIPWIAHFHSTEADRQPDRSDPLTERIEQGAVDSAKRLVTPSRVTADRLVERYGATEDRIDVVANTLSEGASPTAEMGRFETKRVLFLGRLSPQKGVDRFCAVASMLRDSGLDARFEAVGDGPDAALLRRYHITWNGAVGWDERGKAFIGASVLLVPSRSEPFGMVILEAMQHRVPVIYPDDSGAAEVLTTGIKVAADDISAMATAVRTLLSGLDRWEDVVRDQAREIETYPARDYPDRLMAVWTRSLGPVTP